MQKNLKWVEIDRLALLDNIRAFHESVGKDVKIYSVLKSNAYGHGILATSNIIKDDVYGFAVNHIDEALKLREIGIENPILVIGYVLRERLKEIIGKGISVCVYNEETVEILGQIGKPINVHIKVDTGLSRQGIFSDNVLNFTKFIQKYPNIKIEGIYTHFANIEDTSDSSYAQQQIFCFENVLESLKKNNIKIQIKHTACTAATILFPQTYFNAVRLGIGIYGLWPSKETKLSCSNSNYRKLKLKPVMTWKTLISQVKWVEAKTPVGYGLTFLTSRRTKIAILPVGYSDGYDRKLSNNSYVMVKGERCTVLGRVMMNIIIVDVTGVRDVKPEDEAILVGKGGMSAEEMASRIGSINYEVVTRINWTLPRIVV